MVRTVVTIMLILLATVCLCAPARLDAWVWRFTSRHPMFSIVLWGIAWPLAFFTLLLVLADATATAP